jgi:hypothetical protein
MRVFKINRVKAEAPIIAIFAIFGIVVSLVFYPTILWFSFLAFPILFLAYMGLRRTELGIFRRKCFLILDEEGIKYCFHLLQQPKSLLWSQVEKVNYQLYEINFRLMESGLIISMQLSYLENPEEFQELKTMINEKCAVV